MDHLAQHDIPTNREYVHDESNNVRHEVVCRNVELGSRIPVVVYLGLGTTALTSTGQLYLDTYAEKIRRPLITVETPVRAFSSFEEQADSQLGALREYGVEEFDVLGSSAGAIAAAYLAMHAQNNAGNLITVSMPNTRKGLTGYARRMPAQFIDGLRESLAVIQQGEASRVMGPGASNLFDVRKIPELAHTARQIFRTSLNDVPAMLDPQTHWTDIAGTEDKITDYRDHLRVIRARNDLYPHSSTSHLIAGQGHAWVTHREYLADTLGNILNEKQL